MGPATLPPQAYTRDILAKAYLWAQSQPESIKKLATTPDALVGLFLRAQRNGDTSFENIAPVSRDNFMNDLKSLASELEQFDGQPKVTHMPAQLPSAPLTQTQTQTIQTVQTQTATIQQTNLDSKSKDMIQDVKNQLNLSSDSEVLRLLIVLGYEKAKMIFPTK